MSRSATLRNQLDGTLRDHILSAFTQRPQGARESVACGIAPLDALLHGGFPAGAIAEIVGPQCSGRTAVALAFVAQVTASGRVCAWVEAEDALDPEAAASSGVDLSRLLWVRRASLGPDLPASAAQEAEATGQGPNPPSSPGPGKALPPGGGGSPHPRSESRGMAEAIATLLEAQPRSAAIQGSRHNVRPGTPSAPNRKLTSSSVDREEQIPTDRLPARRGNNLRKSMVQYTASLAGQATPDERTAGRTSSATTGSASLRAAEAEPARRVRKGTAAKPWDAVERALRAADLLLQAGGFQVIVLDLAGTPAEVAWRIPMATWFRFRATAERSRSHFLLLTQHPCARSAAELVLRLHASELQHAGPVMTGVSFHGEVERQRHHRPETNVLPFSKGPQSERNVERVAAWSMSAPWARAR